MKYKNVSGGLKSFKVNGEWLDVGPGGVVDLPSVEINEVGLERVIEGQGEVLKSKTSKESKKLIKPDMGKENAPEGDVEFKSNEGLKKMTKDQLNDYAAGIGLKKVSQRMRKDLMIRKILRFIKKVIK